MLLRSWSYVLTLAILTIFAQSSDVLDLNLANFEKITKVASGHSTGDWLVKVHLTHPNRKVLLATLIGCGKLHFVLHDNYLTTIERILIVIYRFSVLCSVV